MFGMSFGEMTLILVLALVVVGPKNLPRVARQMGKAYAWARHHMSVIQREINLELRRIEMESEEFAFGPNKKPAFDPPDTRKAYEEKEPAAVPAGAAPAETPAATPPSPIAEPASAAPSPATETPAAAEPAKELSTTGNDLPRPPAGEEPRS